MTEPPTLDPILELRAAADYKGARRAATEVLAAAGSEAEQFEVLVELGRLEHDLGDVAAAEATFWRTAELADDPLRRALVLARLVGVHRHAEDLQHADR